MVVFTTTSHSTSSSVKKGGHEQTGCESLWRDIGNVNDFQRGSRLMMYLSRLGCSPGFVPWFWTRNQTACRNM